MTTDLPTLLDLERRLAEASGPSRELDAAIWLACFEPACANLDVTFHSEQYDFISREAMECDLGAVWVDQMEPMMLRYSSSLDAAVSLAERVLPKRAHIVMELALKEAGDSLSQRLAICLCLAVVRAKIAEARDASADDRSREDG